MLLWNSLTPHQSEKRSIMRCLRIDTQRRKLCYMYSAGAKHSLLNEFIADNEMKHAARRHFGPRDHTRIGAARTTEAADAQTHQHIICNSLCCSNAPGSSPLTIISVKSERFCHIWCVCCCGEHRWRGLKLVRFPWAMADCSILVLLLTHELSDLD